MGNKGSRGRPPRSVKVTDLHARILSTIADRVYRQVAEQHRGLNATLEIIIQRGLTVIEAEQRGGG